jgi:hypothetical protein
MNPFKSMIKMFNSAITTAPTAPAPNGGVPITPEAFKAANSHTELDSFQIKYSLPPYFYDGTYRGKCFMVPQRPGTSERQKDVLFKKVSPICSASDLELLGEYHAQWAYMDDRMSQLSFLASTAIWLQEQGEARDKILAGELVQLRSKEQIKSDISEQRKVLHQAKAALSKKVYELMLPMAEKLESVARELCAIQDEKERSLHESNVGDEVPFIPTAFLRSLAFVALHTCAAPLANYEFSNNLPPPDPANLKEFWFPNTATLARPAIRELASENPIVVSRREAVVKNLAEAHAAAIAEKNVTVENIKKQAAEDAAAKAQKSK